jgi:hypothetical protein
VVRPYGGTLGVYYDFKSFGPVRLGVDVRGDVLTSNKRADSSQGGRGVVRQYTSLGGLRASVPTPIRWLHPYAEIAGGLLRGDDIGQYTTTTTTVTFSPQTSPTATPPYTTTTLTFNPTIASNYTLVKGFVGADVTVFPFLDLRIELGEGEAFGSPINNITVTNTEVVNGNTGVTTSTSSTTTNAFAPNTHGSQSVEAGLVFHFGH